MEKTTKPGKGENPEGEGEGKAKSKTNKMADPKVVAALTALFLTEECCHQNSLPLLLLNVWMNEDDSDDDCEGKRAPIRKYLQHQLAMCNSDETTSERVDNILQAVQNNCKIPREVVETLTGLVKESFNQRNSRRELRKTVLQNYISYLETKEDAEKQKSPASICSLIQSEVNYECSTSRKNEAKQVASRTTVKREVDVIRTDEEPVEGAARFRAMPLKRKATECAEEKRSARRKSNRKVKRPRKMDL